jgi:hypothetical protein
MAPKPCAVLKIGWSSWRTLSEWGEGFGLWTPRNPFLNPPLISQHCKCNVQNFSTSQFTVSSPGAVCVKNLKPQKASITLDGFCINWPLSSLCTVIRARLLSLLSDMMSDNRLSLYSVHWFWFNLSCCPDTDSITITRSSIFTCNARLSIFAAVKSGGARSESGGAAAPPAPA